MHLQWPQMVVHAKAYHFHVIEATKYKVQKECAGTYVRAHAKYIGWRDVVPLFMCTPFYVYFFINFLLDAITAFCWTIFYYLSNHSEHNSWNRMDETGKETGSQQKSDCVLVYARMIFWTNEKNFSSNFSVLFEGLNECSTDNNIYVFLSMQ